MCLVLVQFVIENVGLSSEDRSVANVEILQHESEYTLF